MFHNRIKEIESINHIIASDKAELVVVYGRRGVGKSALLEHVLNSRKDKFIYFRATRRTLSMQLTGLTEACKDVYPEAFLSESFTSFSSFLNFLAHISERASDKKSRQPPLVVIDEISYLHDVDEGCLTELQHWWDANKRSLNIKLFLCGSYVSFMEKEVLGASAPLYNRRTHAMKLEALRYNEAALFFPSYSSVDKVRMYAVLGGLPYYLEQFDSKKDLSFNIKDKILRQNTYLSEEPEWLLLEDLRKDVTYGSILRAVAEGARRPSDIARAIGKKAAQDVSLPLEKLQLMGFVRRDVPITESQNLGSRNSLYFVADNFLSFWYRFVDPSRSLISRGLGDRVWKEKISKSLDEYVSKPAFEEMCKQYIWKQIESQEQELSQLGSWWGKGDIEIDLIGLNAEGNVTLAGSAKWTNAKVDVADYASLKDSLKRSELNQKDVRYVLFSRSGFTKRLHELYENQNPKRLALIDVDDLFR